MILLLTGCTGFVGRFVLREILSRSSNTKAEEVTVYVLLRGKKSLSAQDRWTNYIKKDSLFAYVSNISAVKVIEGDLDSLHIGDTMNNLDIKPDCVIHCAANVKTLDTYANLYRDNVLGVKHICDATLSWGCKRLILLSTCYVHPRGTVGKSELLPKDLPKSLFTTEYTYTKYLGEHVATEYADRLAISILRLSCVGAPMGWLDAHPTPAAMAHLGILSLILQKRLWAFRIPSTAQLSTVPVDLVATQIANEVLRHGGGLRKAAHMKILQICATPSDTTWNLSFPRLFSTLQGLAPNLSLQNIDCTEEEFGPWLRKIWGMSSWTPWGYKSLRFHEEVNAFISKFADGQRFESSMPADAWPSSINAERVYEQTCQYVARGNHQHKLEKGYAKSNIDLFWSNMSSHTIRSRILFKESLVFSSKQEAEERFYAFAAAYRPAFTNADETRLVYNGDRGPLVSWTDASGTDTLALTSPSNRAASIELLGTYNAVIGMKVHSHHGIGDGISLCSLAPRLTSISSVSPQQSLMSPSAKSKPLSWEQEFRCGLYIIAFLVKVFFKDSNTIQGLAENEKVSEVMKSSHIQKRDKMTFTASLLDQAYPAIRAALKKDDIVYCVPAAIQGPKERGLNLPQNSFVSILIPWSEGSNEISQLCLRSKSVKFITWLFRQFISATGLDSVRDHFMSRTDCVLSSVLLSDTELPLISQIHTDAPTPHVIPLTITAMTVGQLTHITLNSRLALVSAEKLLAEILATK